MILRFIAFICLFLILSCQPKPDMLEIPQEKLILVLADVHFSEGALLSIYPSQKDSLRDLYYQQIYQIHEISEQAFEHDVTLLKFNPKLMEEIYEKVLEELDSKMEKVKSELPEK
ncbi:MAG: hypothetical protein ACI8VT_002648 [Saprospiraceae bacterium]|jgi:hypothetical protein